MNRVNQYLHGENCPCNACRNKPYQGTIGEGMQYSGSVWGISGIPTAEYDPQERMIGMPESQYYKEIEYAYQQGKSDMTNVWLAAMVCVAVCSVIVTWLRG